MERYFLNANILKFFIFFLCFLVLVSFSLWFFFTKEPVFFEESASLPDEGKNLNVREEGSHYFLNQVSADLKVGAVDNILVEPIVTEEAALSSPSSLFESLSASMAEQLFEEDTSAIDTQLLYLMSEEDDLALVVKGREAVEDYIVRKIHLGSLQEKYQWLLLLKNIGVTSAATQQLLLKEIETMKNADLLGEALRLLEPIAGGHEEEMMNFLSLYVGHPSTTVSGAAVATLDLWSLSLQSTDF